MPRRSILIAGALATGAALFAAGRQTGFAQQNAQRGTPSAQQGAQQQTAFLIIEKYTIGQGRSFNQAVEEASEWVRTRRQTGEYNNVRLYTHLYGSDLAVYVFMEPKSWQAIRDGSAKFFSARAQLMTSPFNWTAHDDNILTEVPVQ